MKLFKLNKFLKKNLFFFFFIIIILHSTDFFYNSFSIINRNYDERMIRSYGDCEKEAYGFIKKSYQIVNKDNLRIINFEDTLWPNIENIFNDLRTSYNPDYIIYLNLKNPENRLNSENNIIHNGIKFNFNPKNIVYKNSNCYLIKND